MTANIFVFKKMSLSLKCDKVENDLFLVCNNGGIENTLDMTIKELRLTVAVTYKSIKSVSNGSKV